LFIKFETLNIIGFGDYVAGIPDLLNGDTIVAVNNLLFACCYIVVGISVLGMVNS
jgi:hypothetical protein